MKKLWGGRFKKKLDKKALEFSSSISFDKRLAKYDVLGSIAHAKMLGKTKIITKSESDILVKGLKKILSSINEGKFSFDDSAEDIHTNIQNELEKIAGRTAEKLHIARSRNDQVSLDTRMYLKDEIKNLKLKIRDLQFSILRFAKDNIDVIIPGYTHLQRGQPVLLAHQFLSYLEMLERDIERLSDSFKRVDIMPLGSCALAGTSLPIDRNYVAKILGFSQVSQNSMDSVSDRDFVVEVLADLAILSMHLSRVSEDLILWSTSEFGFIQLPDEFSTGSSIMPQKKNPDILELIRAKTGEIYGNLFSVLTILKGLPLSYNRDLQLDKPALFNSIDSIKDSLDLLSKMIPKLKLNLKDIERALKDENLFTTDVMECLIKKGLSWKEAHDILGRMTEDCLDRGRKISDLDSLELKKYSEKLTFEVKDILNPYASINLKRSYGSTNPKLVIQQLKWWKKRLVLVKREV